MHGGKVMRSDTHLTRQGGKNVACGDVGDESRGDLSVHL